MNYIGYNKRKKKLSLQSHTGKNKGYCERVQAAAGEYGGNRKTLAAREYADSMYALAFDARMLYRAYKDQKGCAAGIDDVPVKELGRYGAYVEWANACKIPFQERPPYATTIFPHVDARVIALLGIACDPEHSYRLKGISFSDGRAALGKLRDMGSLCTTEQADKLVKEFQNEDPLTYRIYSDLTQTVSVSLPVPEALFRAGMIDVGLVDVAIAVFTELEKAISDATFARAKDKVLSFTPWEWLKDEKAAEKHLTWKACRWIQDMMKRGSYRPQALRALAIPKSDGGTRTLNIPTVIDRTVERAAFMTIEPMLEKRFRPNSVGCRNDLDRFDALAAIHNHYPNARGKYILCADIRKAFDNVPHEHLLACLEKHIKNSQMLRYLEMVITRPGTNRGTVGIHQGGPLSPMFLNVLLHEHLDYPFLKRLRSDLIYIRYVDDLAVFGFESEEEGLGIIDLLQNILKPIGLSLHTEPPKTQIVNLAHGNLEVGWGSQSDAMVADDAGVDRYLGLGLCGNADGELEFFLPHSWQERIADMYHHADDKIKKGGYSGTSGAHTHILHATMSWLHAFAPAWREKWQHEITERIVAICRQKSPNYGDMSSKSLAEEWENRYKGWFKRCSEVQVNSIMGWRSLPAC